VTETAPENRRSAGATSTGTIWTIGHSTLDLEQFLALLETHSIEALADVRRFPASRRYQHFNRVPLAVALAERGIRYAWIEALGGRRTPTPESVNTAWRNAAFRGYADHMQTAGFTEGFAELLRLVTPLRTAIMCSEAVWWRCHRGLLSDLLLSRGKRVMHIGSSGDLTPHPWTPAARLLDGTLTYDAACGHPAARLRDASPQASLL
jgi:uncharacterized protein (DUF488 family)